MILYNHDVSAAAALHGIRTSIGDSAYAGRVLGATMPGDKIFLPQHLRRDWDTICAHYAAIGLNHTHDVEWRSDFKGFADFPGTEISVFMFLEAVHRERPDEQFFQAVQYANSKNAILQRAVELGIPIPKTRFFQNIRELEYREFQFPFYLKADISASGHAVIRCENEAQLRAGLAQIGAHTTKPFQLQEEIVGERVTFINVQYCGTNGEAERVLVTEQLLDGYAHVGNRYPTEYSPWHITDPIANDVAKRGLKGPFAFDVAVVVRGDTITYLFIECNPRWNGATYPTRIATKLDIPHWYARTFTTRHRRLVDIHLNKLEYNPSRETGVIIVNWGTISNRTISCMLVGAEDGRSKMLAELQSLL